MREGVRSVRSQSAPAAQPRWMPSRWQIVSLLLIVGVLLLASQTTPPVAAQANPCQLAPVLAMFRDTVGRDRVGECIGQPVRADNDDVTQLTTRGTLTLRALDYVPMFNDGQ